MSTIPTEQVKELRDKTGVSVMQCRKALEEADGDLEKAQVILRKKGSEIAEKKADRSAQDGRIFVKSDGKRALIATLFCETDFVAQNEDFKALGERILLEGWEGGIEKGKEAAPAFISDVVLKIGENIVLGDMLEMKGEMLGMYIHHNGKNAAVVSLTGGSEEVAKEIAMHTAAMKPRFIRASDITEKERTEALEVLQKEVADSDKPAEIKEKMLEGKINTYFGEQTLLSQPFFKNPALTIEKYLAEKGAALEDARVFVIG